MKKPVLLLSALLGLSGGLPLSSARAQATPAANAPTPPQAEQLNERLFRSMYGPGADVQITYGAVPVNLPVRLDPRLSVLASIRTVQNGGAYVQNRVLVSTDLNAEQALEALKTSLEASGWKARPVYGSPIGFATQQTNRYSSYYREGNPNFLLDANLTARAGRTELDLTVNVVNAQTIASIKKAPTYRPQSSLPLLKAMPGVTVKGGGYVTQHPNGSISSAHVITDRSAGEVFAFYSAQLKAAGWKARTDTQDGPLRVVTYSLKDLNGREALGTLGIRPWEKEGGGYVLTVSVQGFKPW